MSRSRRSIRLMLPRSLSLKKGKSQRLYTMYAQLKSEVLETRLEDNTDVRVGSEALKELDVL